MAKDFYAILGVPRNATKEQIRDRFLELTRERHPDRFSGDDKREAELEFQAITQAFNVLTNPDKRREHDAELARPRQKETADRSQLLKVYLSRGVKAYKAKNYLEAADNFRRATEVDSTKAMAWHHLARASSHEKRWQSQALKAIARACELEPMKPAYHKLAGRLFAEAGNKDKALHHFRLALQWGGEEQEIEEAIEALEGDGKKKSLFGGLFGKIE